MMKHYNELMGVNDDLISNYTIRLRNFNEMQKTLKMINEILQRASKLRGMYIEKFPYVNNSSLFIYSWKTCNKYDEVL